MPEIIRIPSAVEPLPAGALSTLLKTTLNNANKFTLNTYIPTEYPGTAPITDWGGTGEHDIRHPAAAALGLAAGLATGNYDPAITGQSDATARAAVARLVSSLAATHRANGGSWGGLEDAPPPATGGNIGWQEALWAFLAGTAGWLTLDALTTAQREQLIAMVVWEADRMLSFTPLFWKDAAGVEQYGGDTKAEELWWDASILSLAVVMLPKHANAPVWTSKLAELGVASSARPSDVTNDEIINGRRVSTICSSGWNVEENGVVINHGIANPDYMVSGFASLWSSVGLFGLGDVFWPVGASFNVQTIYGALSTVNFPSPPNNAPGGYIYPGPGVPDIYYPQGEDWGTHRKMDKAAADVVAASMGWDAGLPVSAEAWGILHLQAQVDLQGRFTDGRTYTPGDLTEDSYGGELGRECWIAHHAGLAMLALSSSVIVSNDPPYSLAITNADRGRTFDSTDVPATGGIELEVLNEPVQSVGVTVRGLTTSGPSTFTIERRIAGEDWSAVPGMVERSATAAFYDIDYSAPIGVSTEYRVVMISGPEPLVLTGTVLVPDTGLGWLQDPANPRTAVAVSFGPSATHPRFETGSFRTRNRPAGSELVTTLGGREPVGFGGVRQRPRGIPFSVIATTPEQTQRLEVLLDTAYPLLVRTPPRITGFPRVAYLDAEVGDDHYDEHGEANHLSIWRMTGAVVRAPLTRVVVGRWTYADVAELWPGATYAQIQAARPGDTYLDFMRDPTGAVLEDTDPPSTVTGLAAVPVSHTSIELTWSAATDDVAVAGYEYRVDGGPPVNSGSGLTTVVVGLAPSTAYDFQVRALDTVGRPSAAWSAIVSATTDAEPPPPDPLGTEWFEAVKALDPGLWWRLGEASGTFADSSGNGRVGNLNGTAGARNVASLVPGDTTDGALRLAGAGNARIDYASWMTSTVYTVIITMKAAASAAEQHLVTRSPGVFHLATAATTGVAKMGVYGSSTVGDMVGTTNVRDNLPHMIAVVVNGTGQHALYVDGVVEATLTHTPVSPTDVIFSVGNRGGANTHWFSGDVDEAIFMPGRALDATDIGALFGAWAGT